MLAKLLIGLLGVTSCLSDATTTYTTTDIFTASVTTATTSSAAPTPAPTLDQCSCTDKNIWIDVYFLIDSSKAMTSPGFDG
ncbi:hypothetical protein OESDEN_18084, partial [Oesophagostomum dentatum]